MWELLGFGVLIFIVFTVAWSYIPQPAWHKAFVEKVTKTIEGLL